MQHQPQCINHDDPVKSYRDYYNTKQDNFTMVWSKRDVPDWIELKEMEPKKELMHG